MNSQRLTERFIRYVECGSESGNEANFCMLLEDELIDLGLVVKRDKNIGLETSNGWNVFARLAGEGDAILFSAHMDTVSPGNNISPVIDNGIIRSSGDTILGADDKAAIAALMEAIVEMTESGTSHRTIEVLFSVCEEIGMLGAKHADYDNITSRKAIVLDSDNLGDIINRNPANVVLHFKVFGKSAHAGLAPQEGIHALKAAAEAVANIPVGKVDEISVMNISNFISEGKTNIIADEATFDMEFRSFEEERLQKYISTSVKTLEDACKKFGASFEMNLERHSDVLYVPENSTIIAEIKKAFRKLGVDCKVTSSFGGCDATYLFANDLEVVNLGIGMQAVHSCDENISINDLETITKLIGLLLKNDY